jgi:uncharacterized protein
MTKLHISPDLTLPEATVTSTILVLGGKGMGKTNLDAVIAEECAAAGLRFSWMDPIGIAWSLQHGANKTEPGLEVLVLGGVHGDIPIEPAAGAVVADLVVDHDVSVVIDISRRGNGKMWSHGEQIRFVTDYMVRLYERQGERRRPLLQIFDEIGRFAPQKIPTGAQDIAKCLGAIEQVVELGRNVGIGMLMSTQRNAKVAAAIRELADAMFAFRTVGPLSLKAVIEWLGDHVDQKRINPLVEQIRSLPVGHAMLISPGWLQIEKVVPVRKRTTFDASATPTGKGSRAPGKARKPDLAKFQQLMAATIERQKNEDPRELQKTLATLRRELEGERKRQPAPAKTETKVERVEVRILKPGEVKILTAAIAKYDAATKRLLDLQGILGDAVGRSSTAATVIAQQIKSALSAPPPSSVVRGRTAGSNGDGAVRAGEPLPNRTPALRREPPVSTARTPERDGITARQQRFLDAIATLAALDVDTTRETVSAWLGIHPRGGSVGEELKALEEAGLIGYERGAILLTAAGHGAAMPVSDFDAIEQAKRGLSPRQQRVFDIVTRVYPETIARDAIAEEMGIHPRGGSFGEDIGRLRGRGLVTVDRGAVRARDFLFAGSARGTT